MYFYDVEDSRCPLDVTCLWEGKVSAMIHTSNQTHKIGGGFEIGYPLTYITPYTITLIDVQPHPISTEKPDYVAILDISKIEPEPEPTPQVKALCESPEVILVDGVCQKIIAEEPIEFFTAEQPPEWLWFVIGGLFMLGMILLIWKKRK